LIAIQPDAWPSFAEKRESIIDAIYRAAREEDCESHESSSAMALGTMNECASWPEPGDYCIQLIQCRSRPIKDGEGDISSSQSRFLWLLKFGGQIHVVRELLWNLR